MEKSTKTVLLNWSKLDTQKGQREFEGYPKGSEGIVHEEVRNALQREGINIDKQYTLILGAWVEWKDGIAREIGPYGGVGSMDAGVAFACDDPLIDADLLVSKEPGGYHYMVGPCSLGMYNTLYIGGIAHELGHAFGLPHEAERDSQRETHGISLMGQGNHYYGKALRDGEGHDTFQLGKHDAFLTAASAQLLSVCRAFDPDFTPATGRWNMEELDASFQNEKLIITLKVVSGPTLVGVIAYNYNLSIPGDYDAKTWLAVAENPGEFRLEIDELDQVPYEMRLRFVVPGGWVEMPIRYSNTSGTPTVQAFSDTLARIRVNALLDQKAWDAVAEVIEKQLEKFPKSRVWAQKLKHLDTVRNPPEPFEPDKVPEEVKMIDLTYAKALEERVGWYEPSRGIVRDLGFLEVYDTFFDSGIFAHADSLYAFAIGKKWSEFSFRYGIQDPHPGTVVFVVRGDGKEIFRSKTVKVGELHFQKLDVSDVEKLELITEDAGDNNHNDWGIWLDPQLSR